MAFRYNPGQAGLPGFDADERLPSEQALTGEVLTERRQEARRAIRGALGPCPEGFAEEEWAVVLATLAPETALGMAARADRTRQARRCFPGESTPAALRKWLEVSMRPHVRQVVADLRALEVIDVMAQREQVREVLMSVMALGLDVLDLRAIDPSGAAKCGAAAVAAAKVFMELGGLREVKTLGDDDAPTGGAVDKGEDPLAALARKVALVAADVDRRRVPDVLE